MSSSSTRATGTNVARNTLLAAVLAVLAGCGGGGGSATPGPVATTDPIPTGSTVSVQSAPTPIVTTPQRVNAVTAGQQVLRAVGALADGSSTIAWLSQASGSTALAAQHFDANGARAGGEVAIGLDPAQTDVAVAVLPDGGFAVATVRTAPASDAEPWITRTSITVRRHDPSGAPLGSAQELAAVLQDRTAATTLRYVAQPQVRAAADGSFVAAWAVVTEDAAGKVPQFFAQRFDAAGQPAAARDLGTGASETTLQLAISPAGGWYAGTASRVMGRTVLTFKGFDGAAAPQLPAGALGSAEGSLLVPLQDGGTALLAPSQVYGTFQMYDAAGQPRGTAAALRTMPVAGVGLRNGGFVLLESVVPGTSLVGQRYDGSGAVAGSTFSVESAGVAPQLAALHGGAVMAAWTSNSAGDQDVMAQRVQP